MQKKEKALDKEKPVPVYDGFAPVSLCRCDMEELGNRPGRNSMSYSTTLFVIVWVSLLLFPMQCPPTHEGRCQSVLLTLALPVSNIKSGTQ